MMILDSLISSSSKSIRKGLLLLILLFSYLLSQAQVSTGQLNGTIIDAKNGETLTGATVELVDFKTGTTSNNYGFYSIQLPTDIDSVTIRYSYIGYLTVEKQIAIGPEVIQDISLDPESLDLQEVLVSASSFRARAKSTQMSVEDINAKDAKLLPALFGEVDIIKTIQLKPGVSSGSEGSSGLYVRGGGSDQNLIILDEATVYNASHLFGFFSTFNADAIKDVKIYKGGFPAQYGGRLSSVIDVRLNEGNNQKFSGAGGLGLISSRLTLEGPIVKDEGSFIVSGRRTYVDIFTNAINRTNKDKKGYDPIPAYSFYDLNAKVNYKLGAKDHLYLSGYFGRDVFAFVDENFDFNFNWGNGTGTVRWNHQFSSKLFANTTVTYSDYEYNISNKLTGFSFNLGSAISDLNVKTDFFYALNNRHTIRGGVQTTYHHFTVGRLKAGSDDGAVSFSAGQSFDGMEHGIYLADETSVGTKIKLNAGLRISMFSNDGKSYLGLEPRISTNWLLNHRLSIKSSYARMRQYVHLVSNSGLALPTDIWYPSTKLVRPEISDQIAIGYAYLLGKKFLLTNEVYYKFLNNQIEFKDHANLFANDEVEDEFTFGDGYAYGMELGIEKKEGRLTGWLGYTLARIRKGNFSDIQGGAYFPPTYDRRHDLSVVAIYKLSRRFSSTATFVYGSGDISWLPVGKYFYQGVEGEDIEPAVPVYQDRNTFRLPAYHRLDLGLVIHFFPKWGHQDLTISVYNAYDRRNPYFLYLDAELGNIQQIGIDLQLPTRIVAKQVSLFPLLPSITWNFRF